MTKSLCHLTSSILLLKEWGHIELTSVTTTADSYVATINRKHMHIFHSPPPQCTHLPLYRLVVLENVLSVMIIYYIIVVKQLVDF